MNPDIIELANAMCMRIRLQKLADKQRLARAQVCCANGRAKGLTRPCWVCADAASEARNRALPPEEQIDN